MRWPISRPRLAWVVLATIFLATGFAPATASALTFEVNSTADTADGSCNTTPDCTLREAITAANSAAGTDNIHFAIAGDGPHEITVGSSDLPTVTQPTIIDGTTDASFTGPDPVIEIDGGGTRFVGLRLQGGASTLNGLAINGFTGWQVRMSTAGSNTITRSYIGTDTTGTVAGAGQGGSAGVHAESTAPNNIIGTSSATGRNLVSGTAGGIRVDSAGNAIRNNYVGTTDSGAAALGNADGIIVLGASNNTIGGSGANEGNLISGNTQVGLSIVDLAASNTVRGNVIGLNAAQTAALPNNTDGIMIRNSGANTIGGSGAGDANVISGNGFHGVDVFNEGSDGNVIRGNSIGVDGTGLFDFANGGHGLRISYRADDNEIGGTAAGEGNVIANSGLDGVEISDEATGNRILRNAMFDNGSLGIDLRGDFVGNGVTPNDANDADTRAALANEGQNFPVINSVVHSGGNATVAGMLDAERASTQYRIEIYENTACNSGEPNGEGQTFVTAQNVTTDANGDATFSIPAAGVATGDVVTTAATDFVAPDPAGTSEFSACKTATPPAPSVTATTPASPSNDNNPEVTGTADAAITTVEIHDDSACEGTPLGSGTRAAFVGAGITAAVPSNQTTTLYARGSDGTANSGCSSTGLAYVEDSTAPAAPTLTDSDPDSPANDNSPRIKGSATGATVKLYTTASCTGTVAAEGSPAAFASPGLQVSVANDSTTTFYATATDAAGNTSGCTSSGPLQGGVLDDFNRANGALGSNWHHSYGTGLLIDGNRVKGPGTWTDAWWDTPLPAPHEVFAEMVVNPPLDDHYFYLLLGNEMGGATWDGYAFQMDEDHLGLFRVDNGSWVGLGSPGADNARFQDGDRVALAINGDKIQVWRDRTGTWELIYEVTDTTYRPALMYRGMELSNLATTVRLDDFGGALDGRAGGLTYVEDSANPAKPTGLTTDPASPAGDTTPKVKGTAESGSTVKVYTDSACIGAVAAQGSAADFAAGGLEATVTPNGPTTFYATATDAAGNGSGCSTDSVTYVEDSADPAQPTGLSTDPTSPANDKTPKVKGSAEAGSTVKVYSDSACTGTVAAQGPAADFASPGLEATVTDDSSTTFYATATDAAGNSSGCSTDSVTYVEDSAAPAAPTVSDSDPESPANDNSPRIRGSAEASSTVKLYTNATCTSGVAAQGTAAAFASPGLEISVADNSSTTFYATATDAAGNASACSSSGLTYVEDSTPEAAPPTNTNQPADLRVAYQAAPAPVPGKPMALNGSATNGGPGAAPNAVLTFHFPASATLHSASAGCSQVSSTAVTCSLGTLANGVTAPRQVTIVPTNEGQLNNGVAASSSAFDPRPGNNSQAATSTAALPPPQTRRAFNVSVTQGEVRVKCPDDPRFTPLVGDNQLRFGCLIDAREGRVSITTTAGGGKTQTALFDGGVFKVRQTGGRRPVTEMRLAGKLQNCPKRSNSASSSARRRKGRRLWANGKGRFRTRGKRSSATARGTIWLVEDRCDGSTLTRVTRGKVTVRDFARRKSATVKKGKRYVARPR